MNIDFAIKLLEILVDMIASSRKRILEARNSGKRTIMVTFRNFLFKISWLYSTAIKFVKPMYQWRNKIKRNCLKNMFIE